MQTTLPFPPAVYQLAQANGLGAPLKAYKRPKANPWSEFWTWGGCGLLVVGLFADIFVSELLSGGALLLVGAILWGDPTRFTNHYLNVYTTLSGILFVALPIGLFLWYWLRRDVLYAIYLCSDGLLWHMQKRPIVIRWEDVKAVWRKTTLYNEQRVITGYAVQPTQGDAIGFSRYTSDTLAGIDPPGARMAMEISAGDDLGAYAGLGEAIEEEIVRRRLPEAQAICQGGGSVTCGPVGVSAQGPLKDGELLPWSEISAIQIDRGSVQIKKRPADWLWYDSPFDAIPNVALFIALVNTIRT